MPAPVRVDDIGPGVVKSSEWATMDNEADAFKNTLTVGGLQGDRVSLRFTGTSIAVFGWLPPVTDDPVILSFSIDGRVVSDRVQIPLGERERPQAEIWRSSALPPGDHEFALEVMERTVLGVDFFEYEPLPPATRVETRPPSSPSPSSDNVSSTPTPAPSASETELSNSNLADTASVMPTASSGVHLSIPTSITSVQLVNDDVDIVSILSGVATLRKGTRTETGVNPSESSNDMAGRFGTDKGYKAPTAAIVGAGLGALVLVGAIILGLLYLRRRHRDKVNMGMQALSVTAPFDAMNATMSRTPPKMISTLFSGSSKGHLNRVENRPCYNPLESQSSLAAIINSTSPDEPPPEYQHCVTRSPTSTAAVGHAHGTAWSTVGASEKSC
ncbi:hypothetical protein CC2G_001911 [Coprinopsis cinerea AmutBmut pab1-1]|nr:hypothetical protein CC2G_001911 [Coprinopsis cinerea AmutBmut pab1-1]